MKVWLATSLKKQFPAAPGGVGKTLTLIAARGERLSFQACFHSDNPTQLAEISASAHGPEDIPVLVRRVGSVPMPHRNTWAPPEECEGWEYMPGFVPDPLFHESKAIVGPAESGSFWITVDVPRRAMPGPREIAIELTWPESKTPRKVILNAHLLVSEVVLQKRRNFRVAHWFYADAIANWYKVKLWSEEFWPMCEKYMRNYLAHGNDVMYVPVFTPPTDDSKFPCQLLKVTRPRKGAYAFDWTRVKKWVDLAKKCGADYFEWTHFFTTRGGATAICVYESKGAMEIPLWPATTENTSDTYRNFLTQFLPEFRKFLEREKVIDRSYFHISDEPFGPVCMEYYKKSRGLIRELAPWIKTMDAVSEITYATEKITDIPIPCISHIKPFLEAKVHPCFSYYCCSPRGRFINRHLDTPLVKIRMTGWVLYRLALDGFLQWGYNFWDQFYARILIDPFTVSDGRQWPMISYGDTFVVYPGPDGPLDSIRWEVFAESLQDFALLQTLGVPRDGKLLEPVKDFEVFPRDVKWFESARRRLLL